MMVDGNGDACDGDRHNGRDCGDGGAGANDGADVKKGRRDAMVMMSAIRVVTTIVAVVISIAIVIIIVITTTNWRRFF